MLESSSRPVDPRTDFCEYLLIRGDKRLCLFNMGGRAEEECSVPSEDVGVVGDCFRVPGCKPYDGRVRFVQIGNLENYRFEDEQ